jgi:drug/metabolite transporter (DMT)-like permease
MSTRGTGLALITIALWSTLATLGAHLRHLPPFLLVGVGLTLGGLCGVHHLRQWRVPGRTWVVGIVGLCGYHALLFGAFRHAPAVEANLLNYLWPLLIVLLAPRFAPGHALHRSHLIGGAFGLVGAALIITGGHFTFDFQYLFGYALALAAALIWACYSLAGRRLPPFPSVAVFGFCLVSGLLSLALFGLQTCFSASITSTFHISPGDCLWLLVLGIGTMGLAFITWDAALKRGDPRVIGALAYLTPLGSTLLLAVTTGRPLRSAALLGMLLIIAGALAGSWRLLFGIPAPQNVNHK